MKDWTVEELKMEATDLVSKLIFDFFRRDDIEIRMGADWCCYPTVGYPELEYSLFIIKADEYMSEFLQKRFGLTLNTWEQMWSFCLLHELGHLATNERFTKAQEQKHIRKEKQIERLRNDRIKHFKYFALPKEITATTWAVDWIKNNDWKFFELCGRVVEMFDYLWDKYEFEEESEVE